MRFGQPATEIKAGNGWKLVKRIAQNGVLVGPATRGSRADKLAASSSLFAGIRIIKSMHQQMVQRRRRRQRNLQDCQRAKVKGVFPSVKWPTVYRRPSLCCLHHRHLYNSGRSWRLDSSVCNNRLVWKGRI